MAIKEFDVFVIGTGTAGKTVAMACARAGKSVGIADDREYGGTCANRGCDPKRILVGLTEVIRDTQHLFGKGVIRLPQYSWEALLAFKKKFTDPVPYVHEKNLKELGIALYHQSPKFLDENTLSVEGKTIKAHKVVIASGHRPGKLDIPGEAHALVSDDFLELEQLPESMLFIGGGYVGMELSHVAARMGVDVTLVHSRQRPLKNFDEDMVDYLTKASEELGIKFIFNARVNRIEKLQKYYRITADQGGKEITAKAELIINASGRIPALDGLNLEKGKVTYTRGGITVNERLQNPSNKNIYACGDVADSPGLPLSPLSSYEARIVVSQLLEDSKKESVYPPQPSVVFTLPNLASVGLSEKAAREKGYRIVVKKEDALKWYNAKRVNATAYAFKTILEADSGKILGAHIIGPEAAEMINIFTVAMGHGMKGQDLKNLIFAYPTWGSDVQSMV